MFHVDIFLDICVWCVRICPFWPCHHQAYHGPIDGVCLYSGCLCNRPWVCVCQSVCLFLSEPSCLCAMLSQREGTAVAVHYRERDRGRLEFSGVCLRLRPLLNEECSILLIMLLWLMSLSAESGECNKTLLLFGLFAFLIGCNKRAYHSSPAIHIWGSRWQSCAFLILFLVCICNHVSLFCYLCVVVFSVSNLRAFPLFSLMAFIHIVTVMTDCFLPWYFFFT